MKMFRTALTSALAAAAFILPAAAQPSAVETVEAYTAAFNQEDANAMADLLDPNVEWMVMGENGLEAVSTDKKALISQMRTYFDGPLAVTNSLTNVQETTRGVRVTETATWKDENGRRRSTTSDVVYIVGNDGLIRRVEYLETH